MLSRTETTSSDGDISMKRKKGAHLFLRVTILACAPRNNDSCSQMLQDKLILYSVYLQGSLCLSLCHKGTDVSREGLCYSSCHSRNNRSLENTAV